MKDPLSKGSWSIFRLWNQGIHLARRVSQQEKNLETTGALW